MDSKKFKFVFYIVISAALIAGVIFGFIYGKSISVKDQLPLYKSLRDLSAIIFAVIGAWIAIIYPNALANIFKKVGTQSSEEKKIKILTLPMFFSTGIIIISVGVEFIYPILKQIDFFVRYFDVCRGISYGSIAALFLLQIWCLFIALLPTQLIADDIDSARRQKRLDDAYKPNPK